MSDDSESGLIDELDIRFALLPLRFDRAAFRLGVDQRIEAASKNLKRLPASGVSNDLAANDLAANDWLRVAASFIPLQAFSRSYDDRVVPISIAAFSFGTKIVFVLAFPFLCFLMLGLTVMGMVQIRVAQRGHEAKGMDIEQAHRATRLWWQQHRWMAAMVFLAALAGPFVGWTTPLMLALVGSGIAAVSIIRTLAKVNLVERGLIGGMSVGVLGLLGQLSMSFSAQSTQLLDPNLVTGVLFAGAALVFGLTPIDAASNSELGSRRQWRSRWKRLGGLVIAAVIMGVCSQSYWRGIKLANIREQVESFDGSQLGLWQEWADAAKWLQEKGDGYDKRAALHRIEWEIDKNPNMKSWMLTNALRASVISASELSSTFRLENDLPALCGPQMLASPFLDLKGDYYRIAMAAAGPPISAMDKKILLQRMWVTWNELDRSDFDFDRLKNAELLTELFDQVDGEYQLADRASDVHRWLIDLQVTHSAPFRSVGGFRISKEVQDCDRRATLAGISLMEHYGVPLQLDVRQLRAYLKPNFLVDITPYDYIPKTISRDKLNRLNEIPSPGLIDYLRCDAPLWLALLLVLLLTYATVCSPCRTTC